MVMLSLLVIIEIFTLSTKQNLFSSSGMVTSYANNNNKVITLRTNANVIGGKKSSSSSISPHDLMQSKFLRASDRFEVARRYERRIGSQIRAAYSVLLRPPYDRILENPNPAPVVSKNSITPYTNNKQNVTKYDDVRERVTILLDLTSGVTKEDEKYLQTFIEGSGKGDQYHLHLAISDKEKLNPNFAEAFSTKAFDRTKTSKREILVQLLRGAKDKFVTISRQMLINISQNSDALLPEKDTEVIGLPYTDANGTWSLGCYQTKTLWYQFRVLKGYALRDKNGFLKCDYLNGPFVIKRTLVLDFLERILYKEINDDMIFLVLFKYLKELGNLNVKLATNHTIGVVARSVPFEVQETPRDFWLLFLKKNGLSEGILPNGRKYEFTCEELGVSGCGGSTSLLIAKCCIRELEHLLKNTAVFLLEKKFHFNLDGGTTIGSLKLAMTLPWEKDHDIEIHGRYTRPLWDLRDEISRRYGYSMFQGSEMKDATPECLAKLDKAYVCGYLGIRSKRWRLEVGGRNVQFSDYIRKEETYTEPKSRLKGNVTLTEIDNMWIPTMTNPGRYCRMAYGLEILKHVKHTMDTGKNGRIEGYFNFKGGKWQSCSTPDHHACTDNYLSDGSLQFKDVWL